jgi:hypothetical protein
VRELRSLTFVYEPQEDRILAVVNVSGADVWACWLTRRLILAVLEQARKAVESTSALAKKSAAEFRPDIIAFEQQAAMASTASAMKMTSINALKASAATRERAKQLTITHTGVKFRLELQGITGEAAAGVMGRADFHRILQMLEDEVRKAGWVNAQQVTPDAVLAMANLPPSPVRH